MTPYAVLLVRPSDDDHTIRTRFHVLARNEHPDRNGASGKAGPNWVLITQAYGAIKTAGLRQAWEIAQQLLSRRCPKCFGIGVQGSRTAGGHIILCPACNGAGRAVNEPPRRKK